MKIGPRYKIARRLGANIFDKTQTAKYALRSQNKTMKPRPKSDFGLQLLEKQKARVHYGVMERQFKKYVNEAIAQKSKKTEDSLYERLETRADNVVYRLGLANSRAFARQLVSHGHITINGKGVTIPSINVDVGDKVGIRAGSLKKTPFQNLEAKTKDVTVPPWLKWNPDTKVAEIQSLPKYKENELIFDIGAIIEFYRR